MKEYKIIHNEFYGEPLFNLVSYNSSRDCPKYHKNSKRSESTTLILFNYLKNLSKEISKKTE